MSARKNLFASLAGSVLPRRVGRPRKNADGPVSDAERQRLSRAKQKLERKLEEIQKIREQDAAQLQQEWEQRNKNTPEASPEKTLKALIREQKIDDATGGRGKGMFIKGAPQGKGRLSLHAPDKLLLMGDAVTGQEASTGGGRRVTAGGQNSWAYERQKEEDIPKADSHEGKLEKSVIGGKSKRIDPKCFGDAVEKQYDEQRKFEKKWQTAQSLVDADHSCKLCSFTSKDARDAYLHVTEVHPGRIPDLQIVTVYRCTVCQKEFEWLNEAESHTLSMIGRNGPGTSAEVKKLRRQHHRLR